MDFLNYQHEQDPQTFPEVWGLSIQYDHNVMYVFLEDSGFDLSQLDEEFDRQACILAREVGEVQNVYIALGHVKDGPIVTPYCPLHKTPPGYNASRWK